MSDFLVGFAEIDYTPAPGQALTGQHHVRIAERTRDPLLANAVALRKGEETVVLVSVDVCFLPLELVNDVQRMFAEQTGVAPERLLLHATHSHVAPATVDKFFGDMDPAFVESLKADICKAAVAALARLEPVAVFSGLGQLDHLNWNRRSMYSDGSSVMHGSPDKPGYIGNEGARDPNVGVIFFRNNEGRITGVIANFGTHPNCVENACYYSADLPGEVRRLIKSMFGVHTGVVYLTGAAGNVSPLMHKPGVAEEPWMGEDGLERAGLLLAGEIAKTIAQTFHPIEEPSLAFEHAAARIPMRPYPKPGERAYPNSWGGDSEKFYRAAEADWPRIMAEQSPVEVRLNVVRIGDTVICTNPAELFSEFALAIRRASPARVTLISQLTDGYCGYVPTRLAFTRGGYETWACPTSKLSQDAGVTIVKETTQLLARAFAAI